jgi:hypothetical protein
MKNLTLTCLACLLAFTGFSQTYTTSDGQMIFSWAQVTENGEDIEGPLRWSPFFNFGTNIHFDLGKSVGLYSGLNVKNIGFIANTSTGKNVHRVYSLGIPASIKLGRLDKQFIYGGYEIEFPFHYRNKSWEGDDRSGDRDTYGEWFSDATPSMMNAVFLGLQFYKGTNIKFKYYLDNFLNPDWTRDGVQPNQGIEAQVFSISLVSSLLRGKKFYYAEN